MARQKLRLTLAISPEAKSDLFDIWRYNAIHRGFRAAELWDAVIQSRIDSLSTDYDLGRRIDEAPELRFVIVQRRPKAHGNVVVYQIDLEGLTLSILRVFHTR